MPDPTDTPEPKKRATAAPKKSPRTSYATAYRDLEQRVRTALPVLQNATAEDAMLRLKIACDVLAGP